MNKTQTETRITTIETTIGELIEAVTNVAATHTKNDKEKYMLASQALAEILGGQEANKVC